MASLSTKFYLLPRELAQPKASIYLRLVYSRQKAEHCTGIKIAPAQWDSEKQRSVRDRKLNEELSFLENRVHEIRRELAYAERSITAAVLKQQLVGGSIAKVDLMGFLSALVGKMQAETQVYAPATVAGYRVLQKHLAGFLESQRSKQTLLAQLDRQWLHHFDHYLLTTVNTRYRRPMCRNAATKQHSRLKAVLQQALEQGHIAQNPYSQFRLRHDSATRKFLTADELQRLQTHPLAANASLQRVRDLFLFSVYTGLRYSDVVQLRQTHMKQDPTGRVWLEIQQYKTGDTLHVPLLDEAHGLLARFAQAIDRPAGFLLPRVSNQRANACLKTIAELAGIEKVLTFHVARHTFATTITLGNHIPIEVVSKLLGHRDLKTTQIYAKITQPYLAEHIDRLNVALQHG